MSNTKLKLIFAAIAIIALSRCASKPKASNDQDLMAAVNELSSSQKSASNQSQSSSGNQSDTSDLEALMSSQPSTSSPSATASQSSTSTQSTSSQSTVSSPTSLGSSSSSSSPSGSSSSSLSELMTPPPEQGSAENQTSSQGSTQSSSESTSAAPQTTVKSIRFISSADGGSVEIKTDQPTTYSVRTNPDTNQTVIKIPNSTLPASLQRPYIMNDFNSPFGEINAYQNPGSSSARIVVQMKNNADQPVVSQVGNAILLTPASSGTPLASSGGGPQTGSGTGGAVSYSAGDKASYNVEKAEKSRQILGARTLEQFLMGSNKFFGRPISIETNNANVRDVINFIADQSGVNIVMDDDVKGKISLKLRQVPWDQALVIVMDSEGLGYIRQGNVLRIMKLSALEAQAKQEKTIIESQKNLTPLKVKVIPVSYANVKDLVNQIQPFLTPNRGKVVSDPRTSSLIITDTADVLARVTKLIKALDIPPAQVEIEGKVVEAQNNFSRSIGVNWGFGGVQSQLSSSGGFDHSPITYSSSLSVSPVDTTQGSTGAIAHLNVGVLDFVGNLSALLNLAETDQLVRIISSPRIVTMNKHTAQIIQKGQVIYVTHILDNTTQTQTSQPVAKNVSLSLKVTPQITAAGSVILNVHLIRQFAGAVVDPTSGARPINTREADTEVLVPNGQTAVIGGIYEDDTTKTTQGVPWLDHIPGLGWLFKNKSTDSQKTELLLFLTPRILNPQSQTAAT